MRPSCMRVVNRVIDEAAVPSDTLVRRLHIGTDPPALLDSLEDSCARQPAQAAKWQTTTGPTEDFAKGEYFANGTVAFQEKRTRHVRAGNRRLP